MLAMEPDVTIESATGGEVRGTLEETQLSHDPQKSGEEKVLSASRIVLEKATADDERLRSLRNRLSEELQGASDIHSIAIANGNQLSEVCTQLENVRKTLGEHYVNLSLDSTTSGDHPKLAKKIPAELFGKNWKSRNLRNPDWRVP